MGVRSSKPSVLSESNYDRENMSANTCELFSKYDRSSAISLKLLRFYVPGLVSLAAAQRFPSEREAALVQQLLSQGHRVIVTNPTAEDVHIISKSNVLDDSSTRSFSVSKDGKEVQSTGVRIT
ncbi:hypothetical protein BDV98DRAFT_594050 [Pterulicium gracile]|uniref:Uncharacterized protein n=1 Tax=Pterulicium gracile TaxID=1884261 RepID=A0A5C3QGH7_9AGAR|nr:hypothetical protein BDV98DRAFT_594050 [Pterula gracilis]